MPEHLEYLARRVVRRSLGVSMCVGLAMGLSAGISTADDDEGPKPTVADRPLGGYFATEVQRIAGAPLLGVDSAEEWKAKRPELQRQAREMLSLDPLPDRTDLKAEVRGTLEQPDFVVERIVFQSMPGLYVTGNLYRPKEVAEPLPAILYVCGHAPVVKDGVIYGNKAAYQHHGAWFAANGYVCLVVDTLQLGEVPGLHHGTYREGKWWWHSRGYTPAGIEAWNGIRAIDYLVSRPEVDPTRLGVSGRSGGGATSWWVGALDDRVAAVVPVAGITDLYDHVICGNVDVAYPEGVIQGHCDCMFTVNTYRWDYEVVAALLAPKAMQIQNTDVDPIFPEAGVRRIYDHLETVYGWYGDLERLDLVIGSGGHEDTVELRHAAFAWFERWLQGKDVALSEIDEPDRSIPVEDLKVLDADEPLPPNRNDTIEESFVQQAITPPVPGSMADWDALKSTWMEQVKAKVFGGWPTTDEAGHLIADRPYRARSEDQGTEIAKGGLAVTAYDFWTELHPEPRLRIWMFHDPGREPVPSRNELVVMGKDDWNTYGGLIEAFESEEGDPAQHPEFERMKRKVVDGAHVCLFAPSGIGPTAWPEDKDTHIRRRFVLLGQTLDGMRILDVRRAVRCVTPSDGTPLWISGSGEAATLALWAAVFEPGVKKVVLNNPPATVRDGPALLNLERILGMPQALALLYPRPVTIEGSRLEPWTWPRDLAEALGHDGPWPAIEPN